MDLQLAGRIALVTAATKGLGLASARALAREGASVAICARTAADVSRVASELSEETGTKVLPLIGDVGRAEDLVRVVAETVAAFGALHVVVANGGGPPPSSFLELAASDDGGEAKWRDALEGTLLSTMRLFRAALPHMQAAGHGRMLVITSSSVREPIPGLLLSNVTRPALVGLCKTLAKELGPFGITVNNVAPGSFDTDRLKHVHERMIEPGVDLEAVRKKTAAAIPLGRFGHPDELGKMIAFLASDAASYVSGQTIVVDGAKMASL